MHWLWVMKATFDGCGLKKNLTMRWGMTVMQQIILESRCFGQLHIFIVSSAGEWLQWASINSWTKLKDSWQAFLRPPSKGTALESGSMHHVSPFGGLRRVNHTELWPCGKMYLNNSNNLFFFFFFSYHCMKCQEMKTPTSDQTNKTENGYCLFFLTRTGTTQVFILTIITTDVLCIVPITHDYTSTLEHRASCRVCRTNSANPKSLWLWAQPLTLAAPFPTPAPFSRLRNSTGHL